MLDSLKPGAVVQCRLYSVPEWQDVADPAWDWVVYDYRIKPREPRKISVITYTSGALAVYASENDAKFFAAGHLGATVATFVEALES